MKITEYVRQAYDYHYWATKRYFTVAQGLTPDQLHKMQGHSWGDVHAMFVHIMSSEWVWLQRWHGHSPKGHLDKNDFPTLLAVQVRRDQIEGEMREFLAAQTEEALEKEIRYSNFSGEEFHVPLYQMLLHVANHGTHHRGELAAMFALMGVAHPEEEAIQYFLNLSGQKKF